MAILLVASLLRLVKLDQNPPSLYWDEVSLGYNAYSILTTGHDEHGEFLPLARFIAFGDYKPPGYIYTIVPFMAILGPTEWAVRLPSALAGIGMVLGTFFLVRKLFKNDATALIAADLIAISPWDIQLSRGAFESHLATFFNLLAVLCFIYFPKKKWLLIVSTIFFMLAFYTFNANRILSPLLLLLLGIIYWKDIWQNKKWVVISAVVAVVMLVPSISYLTTRESRLRFQEVSIFTSLDTVKKANERIERSGNTWWANIIHNRRVYFARDFLSHFADQFKGQFLFISGDANPRLSIQDVGELYLFEAPFLVIGLYQVLKRKDKTSALLFGWLLLAPIPAATARETPHMLRAASMLPTFQVFTAVGIYTLWELLRLQKSIFQKIGMTVFTIVVILSVFYYQHNYWVHYPIEWSGQWQYGYKQMVAKVKNLENKYDRVIVTSDYGRPYIYFLFYNRISPLEYDRIRQAERDWYGLWNVYGFGKYDFTQGSPKEGERVLRVTRAGGIDKNKIIDTVKAPNGEVIFEIGEQ
jgi:4-amino-4-deoxy-L-arabinose transferase-like glycosyltransferase